MKTSKVLFLFLTIFCASLFAQDYSTRTMKLKFNNNGHEYSVRDFISYEMNQLYLAKKEYIRERIRQHTDDQQGVSDVDVYPPNNIEAIKFSSGDLGKGKLEFSAVRL